MAGTCPLPMIVAMLHGKSIGRFASYCTEHCRQTITNVLKGGRGPSSVIAPITGRQPGPPGRDNVYYG